jgi:hypothetical protein
MEHSKEGHKVDLHTSLSDNIIDKKANEIRFKQNIDRLLDKAKLAEKKRQNKAKK